MFTWTDTPIVEMWRHLRYLRSPANVVNVLTGKLASHRNPQWAESDEIRERAYEIAACVRQADEYFAAAEAVGSATRPLLLFYGVESLAKAIIVAKLDDVRLANLKYHGLGAS